MESRNISSLNLIRGDDFIVNEKIIVRQPTLSEICDYGEKNYYGLINCFCSTPYDNMVILLDRFGIDYEKIDSFDMFRITRYALLDIDTSILIKGISFKNLEDCKKDEKIILYDRENDVGIDREIFNQISNYLRTIHFYKNNEKKFANETTKQYVLNMERRRLKRKNPESKEGMAEFISASVNSEGFKYDFDNVWNLKIYQFLNSIYRLQKIKNSSQLIQGMYSGNIDSKNINEKDINWIGVL